MALAGCTRPDHSEAHARQEPSHARDAPLVSGGDPGFDDDVRDVVGHPAPPWDVGPWFNSAPLAPADLRGKVVLVRWFMSPSCPLCSASAPALVELDHRYRARGLAVIGMYHHKDDDPLDPEKVRGYVAHFGFTFPVAIDPDWRTGKRWWQNGHKREYTSVSFLLDRAGIVRHVHLGGQLAPGSPAYAIVEERIKALLAEP
jgi:thiol-disulfide isomerase/thioredoxin